MALRYAPPGQIATVVSRVDGAWALREHLGARYEHVMDGLRRVFATNAARYGAIEEPGEPDLAVHRLPDAVSAVRFALDVQAGLHAARWPAELDGPALQGVAGTTADGAFKGPRLAMGVHAGGEDAGGRARAVAAAAHGGQVLLSDAAWRAAGVAVEGLPTVDWGRYPLAGFERREHLRGVLPVALRLRTFPRPRTPDPRRTNLPVGLAAFFGREAELAWLHEHVKPASIVTVHGGPGVGKTRLALRFAGTRLAEWPGGIWFSDASLARDARAVAAGVAAAMGLQLTSGSAGPQVGEALAGRGRTLVLLDAPPPEAAIAVARWREVAPQVAWLIATDVPLGVPGEQTLDLQPLPVPDRLVSARRIAENPAVRLFLARAAAISNVSVDADATTAAIVRRLQGVPLAIQLAAARLGGRSSVELLTELEAEVDEELTSSSRLRAAVEVAWSTLAPWEQATLSACTVFRGGFALPAAEAVVDLRHWPGTSVWEVVRGLAARSLLRAWEPPETPGEVRYELQGVVGPLASSRLPEADRILAEERHGRWFARLGSPSERDALDAHGGPRRWADLLLERRNLEEGLARALDRADAHTAAGCWLALSQLWLQRGPVDAAATSGARVAALDLDDETRAEVLRAQGLVMRFAGRVDSARSALDASLALARGLGDEWLEGRALAARLGLVLEYGPAENLEEAAAHAIAVQRRSGDVRAEALTLTHLGAWRRDAGKLSHAEAALERAVALARSVGFRRQEGDALGHLGEVHHLRGQRQEARAALEEALAIHRELGHRRREASVLRALAALSRASGDVEGALAALQEALDLAREVGDVRHQAALLAETGQLHVAAGRLATARACYDASLSIAQQVGARALCGQVLVLLGRLRALTGNVSGGRASLEQAVAALRETDHPDLPLALARLAEVSALAGDAAAARLALAEAERLAPVADAASELAAALGGARARLLG